jgi:hypothetical protein
VTLSFWVSSPPEADEFAAWDPDGDPARYASGVGHNVLELAKRVQQLGRAVAVGSEALPSGSPVVFLLKDAYSSGANLRGALAAVQRARGCFAVIRSDTPSSWSFPISPSREFVATKGGARMDWQLWLPPLPQRGLRPRAAERAGGLRSLVLKCNPENIPAEVATSRWARTLAARGVEWSIDSPSRTDGYDQTWHDFTDVDAVLCAPHPGNELDPHRKPATRLINAWVAGCIPLVAREPAYLELASDGMDALFFERLDECPALVEELRADPSRLRALEQRVAARGIEFSVERTSRLWLEALDRLDAGSGSGWSRTRRRFGIAEKRAAHFAHEAVAKMRTPRSQA